MNARLSFLCAWFGTLAAGAGAADELFDFDVLRFRAKALAFQPYAETKAAVPEWLRALSYDQYNEIQFDARRSWWRAEELPFQLQFFHPGGLFTRPVRVNEVVNRVARPIAFSTRFFDYRNSRPGRVPGDLGFAGFRVLTELNGGIL